MGHSQLAARPDELVQRARCGDAEALNAIFLAYRNYLHLLAELQIHSNLQAKVDASDLVQEVCLQAYRGFGAFRGTTEPELAAWLRKIMATRAAKSCRRFLGTRKRDICLERRLEDALGRSSVELQSLLASPGSSPSEATARREQAVLVADALTQLPSDYRRVVMLHHFEGLSMTEIAQRLQRSVPSVQKLWSRAIVRIGIILKDLR